MAETPEQLLDILHSAEPEARKSVITASKTLDTPDAIRVLVAALADPIEEIHLLAFDTLQKRDLLSGLAARFFYYVGDPNEADDDWTNKMVFPHHGDAVRPILHRMARDPKTTPERREAAITSLGEDRGNSSTTEVLLDLLNEPEPEIVRQSLLSLGWLADPAALPYVLDALDSPDGPIRRAALLAIQEIGQRSAAEAVFPLLADADEAVRHEAVKCLGVLAPELVCREKDRLIGDSCSSVVFETLKVLSGMQCLSEDELRQALHHSDSSVRACAVNCTGKSGWTALIPDLLQLISDTDPNGSREVWYALAQIGYADAAEPLLERLISDDSFDRAGAAGGLAYLRSERIRSALATALEVENHPRVQRIIQRAIRQHDGEAN